MNPQNFTLPVQYVRQIADQVARMGADLPTWFKQSGLTAVQPGDGVQTLSFAAFERLVQEAIELTQEPAFGLLVGERLMVNSHGILGFAAMNSGTIRQVIDLMGSYFQIRTTLLSPRYEVVADELRLIFDEPVPLGAIRRPVLEAVVLTIKNMVDYVTVGACHISRVVFPFAEPDYGDLARDMFKCEVSYGQAWTGMAIPLAVIDLPLQMADPAAFQEATLICQRELDKLTRQESWAAKVRRVMLEKQSGFPSLHVTARLFHLTPHTLHRRLTQEGTSFSAILEDVRHMLAVAHLQNSHLSIQEIAFNLGYTDMANFRRAFKRWESVSPSEFRRVATPGVGVAPLDRTAS